MWGLEQLIKTDPSQLKVVNASNSDEIRYRLRELTEFLGGQIDTYQKICGGSRRTQACGSDDRGIALVPGILRPL